MKRESCSARILLAPGGGRILAWRPGTSWKRVLHLLLLLLTACAGQETATPTPSPSPTPPSTPTPAPSPTAELTYTNPVYPQDFPDPSVIRVDDTYYAYSTNVGQFNIPTIRSENLVEWERLGDALPQLPEWAAWNQSLTWAPGVLTWNDGYILFYTARYIEAGLQCISRAVSETPEGPFADDSEGPLVCQTDLGGSIDPYPFVDEDGTPYLFWKNDGNCCGLPVMIWVQQLADDGLSLVGEPTELIERDQLWEHPLIENPAVWKHENNYYLFYSANWWESHQYAVGYAVCESVTGPCVKPLEEPIFAFTSEVMGPGGETLFTDTGGNLWMAYHAWTAPNVTYPEGSRSFRIDPVTFEDSAPVIHGPTADPQPLP